MYYHILCDKNNSRGFANNENYSLRGDVMCEYKNTRVIFYNGVSDTFMETLI